MMLPTMTILVRSESPCDSYPESADDASLVATLNPATMEVLQLFRGDSVIVRYVLLSLLRLVELTKFSGDSGKKRRDTGTRCLL